MKQFKRIKGTLSTVMSLGLHTDLQMRLYDAVSQASATEKFPLAAKDLETWKENIDAQSDAARVVRAAEETQRMRKKDEERDCAIGALLGEIRQAARSPIPQLREAGRRLKLVADVYKGLRWKGAAEETAYISALLIDLNKEEPKADVETLGLGELVDILETANNEFDAIRSARTDARAARMIPTGTAMRRKNDATMYAVFRHIEAAYLMAASEKDRAPLGELIERMNQIITETKTAYRESKAQKERNVPEPHEEAL